MRVAILFRDRVIVVGDRSGDVVRAGIDRYELDETNGSAIKTTKLGGAALSYSWREATAEDEEAYSAELSRAQQEKNRLTEYNARVDVILARKICSLCNGDVESSSILRLGLDKLREIVAIIEKTT